MLQFKQGPKFTIFPFYPFLLTNSKINRANWLVQLPDKTDAEYMQFIIPQVKLHNISQ